MRKIILFIVILFSTVIVCSQTTAIPDPAFEQQLINIGLDTGPVDGSVPTANIDTVTSLSIGSIGFSGINDLTGIQDFIALEDLHCMMNNLTSLDLSQNTNLTTLYCPQNQLSFIDVSQSPNLYAFDCSNNELTHLDISTNINLVHFSCGSNALNSIDVTNNPELQTFSCNNNEITDLDITYNPNLTELNCSTNLLSTLDVSNHTLLEYLNFAENQISDINVLNQHNLNRLYCANNQLASLDVKQNSNLQFIFCGHNLLTKLNVSENPILLQLKCNDNLLSCLNLKNGNSNNLWVQGHNNPDLNCVTVDDPLFSYSYWVNDFDPGISFTTSCSNLCTVGINLIEDNKISLYPNPSSNWIKIDNTSNIPGFNATIYSLNAEVLIESKSDLITIENLSSGIYIIRLRSYGELIGVKKLSIIK